MKSLAWLVQCKIIAWMLAGILSCTVGPVHNEIQMVRPLRLIWRAEHEYRCKFQRWGDLEMLGPGGANLIDSQLSLGRTTGYLIKLVANANHFQVWAWPESYEHSGFHSLYFDETGTVRESWGRARATVASPVVGSMPPDRLCTQ